MQFRSCQSFHWHLYLVSIIRYCPESKLFYSLQCTHHRSTILQRLIYSAKKTCLQLRVDIPNILGRLSNSCVTNTFLTTYACYFFSLHLCKFYALHSLFRSANSISSMTCCYSPTTRSQESYSLNDFYNSTSIQVWKCMSMRRMLQYAKAKWWRNSQGAVLIQK